MKKKIVFLGNSIVNGFPLKRSQCFVSLYREATGHNVINKGVNGSTTPEAVQRFERDVASHHPDRMVFLGGTNDFLQGISAPTGTLGGYRTLTALCREASIEPVFLMPLMIDPEMARELWMPDVDYDRVADQLLELRDLMAKWGQEDGVKVVDTQSFLRRQYDEDTKGEWLVDGLHPTAKGHEALAGFLVQSSI